MAVFRTNQEKISARQGKVRCGACREVFNALEHAVEMDDNGGFRRLTRDESALVSDISISRSGVAELGHPDSEVEENIEASFENTADKQPVQDEVLSEESESQEALEGESVTEVKENIEATFENTADKQPVQDEVLSEESETQEALEGESVTDEIRTEETRTEESVTEKVPIDVTDEEYGSVDRTPVDAAPFDSPGPESSAAAEDKSLTQPKETAESISPAAESSDQLVGESEDVYSSAETDSSQPGSEHLDSEHSDAVEKDEESSASLDVVSGYVQDPEWDKEWREFSEQEVETAVLDTYIEKRSETVGQDKAENSQDSTTKPQVQNWFNAEPDSLLDNNPFSTGDTASTESAEDQKPSLINMSGVDHYIADQPNPLVNIFWSLVSIAFVILLGLQVKYFFVEKYAQDDRYRSYLGLFCKIAQCELSPRRDAYRFTITNTRIDLHPEEPGALRITVKLLNQAKFTQPFPELQLTLTDRVGRVVGRRTFEPEFYLAVAQRRQLASGELGTVTFDLAHPHEKAVGFVVDVVTKTRSS